MKVVITGASGYIGARLSLFLSSIGHDVTAVCSKKIPQKKGWTEIISKFIIGDIRDSKTIDAICNEKADAIIHLISLDHHDSEGNPDFVSQVNVQSTWNLLDKNVANELKKFIYFSTIHVYGKNQLGSVKETQNVTPFNVYGLTHALSEEICNYYNRKTNIACTNIRLSNSYGEPVFFDAKCWSLIVNDLTKSAFVNKRITLKSDGSAIRDFIHFSDVCKGVEILLLDENSRTENTMHFSSSNSITMLDVAVAVKEVYKQKYNEDVPIFINENEEWVAAKKTTEGANEISNSLAKKSLIDFKKELKDGINDLFIYLEDQ